MAMYGMGKVSHSQVSQGQSVVPQGQGKVPWSHSEFRVGEAQRGAAEVQ